jgi:hypothetical protein
VASDVAPEVLMPDPRLWDSCDPFGLCGCGAAYSMLHVFNEEMHCEGCGISFEEHQRTRKPCALSVPDRARSKVRRAA